MKNHVQKTLRKLNVLNRTQAVGRALALAHRQPVARDKSGQTPIRPRELKSRPIILFFPESFRSRRSSRYWRPPRSSKARSTRTGSWPRARSWRARSSRSSGGDTREIHEAPRTGAGDWSIAVGGGVAVAALWIALDGFLAFGGTPKPFVPLRPDGAYDLPLLAARLVGFVAIVPVIEELFWRSFLMRWIDRRDFLGADPRRASAVALLATSFLFALEHHAWLPGLAAGLLYGMIYRRTGNLTGQHRLSCHQ